MILLLLLMLLLLFLLLTVTVNCFSFFHILQVFFTSLAAGSICDPLILDDEDFGRKQTFGLQLLFKHCSLVWVHV